MKNEIEALMVLNAISGLGSAKIQKILDHYGSAAEFFRLWNEQDLIQILSAQVIENIRTFSVEQFLDQELKLIEQKQVKVITRNDAAYPTNLKRIVGAPIVLYVCGEIPAENEVAIGVVGSRHASIYGRNIADRFSAELAALGLPIVSGMARGIDTAAHLGALKVKGKTIAVLGCGLTHIYPPENAKLFESIANSGAIVSEFPMATPPVPFNFPRRNRVISGISLGIIVVEAALKSGALITANFALEQNKEVYAIPGQLDNPSSEGVHHLIKQGAKLVTSIEDILEDIKPALDRWVNRNQIDGVIASEAKQSSGSRRLPRSADASLAMTEVVTQELTVQETTIYDSLTRQPIHIDVLAERTNTTAAKLMATLFQLEIKQLVKQLPGKFFVRT